MIRHTMIGGFVDHALMHGRSWSKDYNGENVYWFPIRFMGYPNGYPYPRFTILRNCTEYMDGSDQAYRLQGLTNDQAHRHVLFDGPYAVVRKVLGKRLHPQREPLPVVHEERKKIHPSRTPLPHQMYHGGQWAVMRSTGYRADICYVLVCGRFHLYRLSHYYRWVHGPPDKRTALPRTLPTLLTLPFGPFGGRNPVRAEIKFH